MNPNPETVFVAVPIPRSGLLTYLCPEGTKGLASGIRVLVPVGPRKRMIGLTWHAQAQSVPDDLELKRIIEVLDEDPILSPEYMEFLEKVSWYYFYPIGKMIEEALPSLLIAAKDTGIKKILKTASRPRVVVPHPSWIPERPKVLSPSQELAIKAIEEGIESRRFNPVLLHGVTGSGKTEVYVRAAEACIQSRRSALILVPEIALASQLVSWFHAAFGKAVGLWHSRLTAPQKLSTWQRVRSGDIRVVVGVRSAIFAPLSDIGLIVVDEEHDDAYKQDARLRYNARDLGLLLGKLHNATVVLGSATPSVTTYQRALKGKLKLIEMEERVFETPLPTVEMVDLRRAREEGDGRGDRGERAIPWWMSPRLYQAISKTLEAGEQVLLFLNRRGFATFVCCADCGYTFRCPHCDLTLTLHKRLASVGSSGGALLCHTCGYSEPALPLCPKCQGKTISFKGLGTEKVAEELRAVFPGIRAARFDRDTMGSKKRMAETLKAFREGRLDAIVGTQMITKGHDFPNLSLVGVIWGDLSLHHPCFNASERTFQLITQVAGRAGRREKQGRVIIQGFNIGHYSLSLACRHDYGRFFKEEIGKRKAHGYPPYGHLITLILSGRSGKRVEEAAQMAGDHASRLAAISRRRYGGEVEVLGPSPGIKPKIKDIYIWGLLIKSRSRSMGRWVMRNMLERYQERSPKGVRMEIDVDPIDVP